MILLTLIFCFLFVVGAVLMGYLAYRKYKTLLHLKNMRIVIANDLHDEIGAALSSISFYSEACRIQMQNQNTVAATELISKIGLTSRSTIDAMNDIVWMVHPKHDHLGKLFERIENFGKEIFISHQIVFSFKADSSLTNLVLPVDVRKNMYLIIKEALHNAAKYSNCSTVEVTIKAKKKSIHISIVDNGNGFDFETAKEGNGLLNMKVRSAAILAEITITSIVNKGTTINLVVPYPHNG